MKRAGGKWIAGVSWSSIGIHRLDPRSAEVDQDWQLRPCAAPPPPNPVAWKPPTQDLPIGWCVAFDGSHRVGRGWLSMKSDPTSGSFGLLFSGITSYSKSGVGTLGHRVREIKVATHQVTPRRKWIASGWDFPWGLSIPDASGVGSEGRPGC